MCNLVKITLWLIKHVSKLVEHFLFMNNHKQLYINRLVRVKRVNKVIRMDLTWYMLLID